MGVRFRWSSGDPSEIASPQPAPPPRRRLRTLAALLVVLGTVGGGFYCQARQGLSAARAALQTQVDSEVLALQAGQPQALYDLLDSRYAPWLRYHQQCFSREAAWYAARPGARVIVEAVQLASDRAVARLRLWEGGVRTGCIAYWHFRRVDGQWRHTPPTLEAWGAPVALDTAHLSLLAQGPDRSLVAEVAPDLEAFYARLLRLYGADQEVAGLEERIAIRVLPYGASVDGGSIVPSPHLALELWSASERRAVLSRNLRLAIARALFSSLLGDSRPLVRDRWLVEGLATYHAEAWIPEWSGALRRSLADGSYRQFLSLEAPGTISRARELRTLPDTQSTHPLAYALGEFLTTRYPRERLQALLRAIASGTPGWTAVESVLGITRHDFEAAWRLHLEQRYGS